MLKGYAHNRINIQPCWRCSFYTDMLRLQLPGIFYAGEEMPADLETVATVVLPKPNTYQFLLQMLEEPDRVAEYVSTQCMDRVMRGPEAIFLMDYLTYDQLLLLDSTGKQIQCADNFGALDDVIGCSALALAYAACPVTVYR